MSDHANIFPRFVKANSEAELEIALSALQLATSQQYQVINIYENKKGELVAWIHARAETPILRESNGDQQKPRR